MFYSIMAGNSEATMSDGATFLNNTYATLSEATVAEGAPTEEELREQVHSSLLFHNILTVPADYIAHTRFR